MNQGGRPKSSIWEEFLKLSENGKVQAKCKLCGHVMCSKVERMKTHLKKCSRKIQDNGCISSNSASDSQEDNTSEYQVSDTVLPVNKRSRIQTEINSFIVKTDSQTKHALDIQVSRFFYACNIPFLASENSEFVKLCSLLRPGYLPPNRKQLSEDLLNEVYSDLEGQMKEEVEGKECTLIEDGWSNIHNEPVIASSIHIEGKSYFLKATETSSHSKTAEYCKSIAEDSMREARDKFGCSVKCFVTDNARNMEKMRSMMHQEDNTLLVYGCSAHWLNLLGQDITPSQILKPIIEVQKYFRNHHLPSAWLKEAPNTVKPQLPNDTRWNSSLSCIETFLRNRHAYIQIAEEHVQNIEPQIEKMINNFNLYKQAKDLSHQLKPIASALDRLQSENSSLSDACHEWLNLSMCEELKPHEKKVKTRMEQALTPFHYLAYMCHPHSMGELLNETQREKARQCLLSCQPENLDYLIAFEAQSSPFPESYFRASTLVPVTWWKATRRSKIPDNFVSLMVRLHSSPCTSASLERVFSNFAFIQNKIRNRLGNDKAAKLVFCYRMLRGPVDLE